LYFERAMMRVMIKIPARSATRRQATTTLAIERPITTPCFFSRAAFADAVSTVLPTLVGAIVGALVGALLVDEDGTPPPVVGADVGAIVGSRGGPRSSMTEPRSKWYDQLCVP
jgi:hypothetical protein